MNEGNAFAPPRHDDTPMASTPGPGGLDLASRWARLAAAILDVLFFMPPILAIGFALGFYDSPEPSLRETLIGSLIGIAVFLALNGYGIYRRAQTLGKMLCRIRVVDLAGRPLSGNRYVAARLLPIWILSALPVVGGVIGLIDALLIFRREKNCLHDDIARSRVVAIPR